MRFQFGKNWDAYVDRRLNESRVEISKQHMLEFLGKEDLSGLTFLDVGCGSGIHSLAAYRAGASMVMSFDLDPDSVTASRKARAREGDPGNWEIVQGSILDRDFLRTLEPADLVYAWGVLHHTGAMNEAIVNTCGLVSEGGLLYMALYDYDTISGHTPEFWLDIKQRYNKSGKLGRGRLIAWYIWDSELRRNILRIPRLLARVLTYGRSRGMAWLTDVRDWLGGWPMEYSQVPAVKELCSTACGLELVDIRTGEANTEYLFRRVRTSGVSTEG